MAKINKTKDIYVSGDHNIICWVCGIRVKRSEAMKRYDGRLVCKNDNAAEIDPSTGPRMLVQDQLPVKNARPEAVDSFLPQDTPWEDVDTLWELSGVAWEDPILL